MSWVFSKHEGTKDHHVRTCRSWYSRQCQYFDVGPNPPGPRKSQVRSKSAGFRRIVAGADYCSGRQSRLIPTHGETPGLPQSEHVESDRPASRNLGNRLIRCDRLLSCFQACRRRAVTCRSSQTRPLTYRYWPRHWGAGGYAQAADGRLSPRTCRERRRPRQKWRSPGITSRH
jgi:hypothetical protein